MNGPLIMTDGNDPLEQMRQRQLLTQQAAHFRPVNVSLSSDNMYGNVATASTQNYNGSLSKIMTDEGWFTSYTWSRCFQSDALCSMTTCLKNLLKLGYLTAASKMS